MKTNPFRENGPHKPPCKVFYLLPQVWLWSCSKRGTRTVSRVHISASLYNINSYACSRRFACSSYSSSGAHDRGPGHMQLNVEKYRGMSCCGSCVHRDKGEEPHKTGKSVVACSQCDSNISRHTVELPYLYTIYMHNLCNSIEPAGPSLGLS